MMNRIIVTPAGRKEYLELLHKHLVLQKDSFDEWHLWLNTSDQKNIDYINSLLNDDILSTKIVVIETDLSDLGPPSFYTTSKQILNINKFYATDSLDANSLYLKLDDDIVWMEPTFIDKMFSARESNDSNFLIFANTINNSTCSHLHMRTNSIDWDEISKYSPYDPTCWSNPIYAIRTHNFFLSTVNNYEKFYFKNWYLFLTERVSINAVSWRGSDFLTFAGIIDGDDEHFLTFHGPSRLGGKRSFIYGECLCSHFSYKTQSYFLKQTDILSRYKKLV